MFLGAIINANIFGELSLIFSELDKSTKAFQLKLALMNTAMIDLKLPFKIQQNVRHELFRAAPSMMNQNQMKVFLFQISPSLEFQVLKIIYQKKLESNPIFSS